MLDQIGPCCYDPGTMSSDVGVFEVPLDGYVMHLRRSELEMVAAGIDGLDTSADGDLQRLAEAVRQLPTAERAPTWELVLRSYGCGKPVPRAAGEIGLDETVARVLLERFSRGLTAAAQNSAGQ
jgi:hypothetical protein